MERFCHINGAKIGILTKRYYGYAAVLTFMVTKLLIMQNNSSSGRTDKEKGCGQRIKNVSCSRINTNDSPMKKTALLLIAALSALVMSCNQSPKHEGPYPIESFKTPHGHYVNISLIKHGSIAIEYKGTTIQVAPVASYGKHTDYGKDFGKAEFVLVTHEHGDHLNDSTILVLSDEKTVLLLNKKSRDMIGHGEAIGNGETRQLTKDIFLEAVPAYNTTPGHLQYHPEGNGNGYVLTIDGLRIYAAGDTEDVPEMADLKDIDVAFLPVNQPFTMTPEQCVNAANMFKPKVLIPYHFSRTDISGIPAQLPDIDVRLRDMQ